MFLRFLLFPFALLYGCVMCVRNLLFDAGVLRQRKFPLPVVCVGNLAVGGTGKTPHVEYLLRLLAPRYAVAVLSRGYGRGTRGFLRAAPGVTARELGDEPFQMYRKFPAVTVAVDENRCHGLDRLLVGDGAVPDVVVLDDAYQHRYVRAGLYVLLTEYDRIYADDFLLPAGRLRESRSGARRAQVVVVTKCPPDLSETEKERVRRRLRLADGQRLFFSCLRYAALVPFVQDGTATLAGRPAVALLITGIARPGSLRRHLEACGLDIRQVAFPDHHTFTPADVRRMNDAYSELPAGAPAFTTEKDAVRLLPWAGHLSPALRAALLVQPIEVGMCGDTNEIFNQIIIDYVTENQRDGAVDKSTHRRRS